MSVSVRIPTPLRRLTDGQESVTAEGSDLAKLIADLEVRCPGMVERLLDDQGNLRRFINIYVNDEDVRFLQGTETPLRDGDQVSIVPAIAGGAKVDS